MRALLATQGGRSADALRAAARRASGRARDGGGLRARPGLGALSHRRRARARSRPRWPPGSARAVRDDAEGLLHPAGDLMVAALASLELGRPAEARELAARGRDVSVEQGVGFQAAWLAWAVATIDLITGYAEDAAGAFRELVATAARSGFGQVERLASLGMVECCALTGDAARCARVDGARRVAASRLPLPSPCTAPWPPPGSPPSTATPGPAIALVVAHGDELVERGELREAVVLLDEAVMFGDPPAAARMLAVIDAVDTPVGRARGMRARALLSGDPADLLAAAEEFAACGFVHSAATQAAQAARALRAARRGARRRGRRGQGQGVRRPVARPAGGGSRLGRGRRPADAARARDRQPRRAGPHQQGGRRRPRALGAHRRQPPRQRLREARHPGPRRARRRARASPSPRRPSYPDPGQAGSHDPRGDRARHAQRRAGGAARCPSSPPTSTAGCSPRTPRCGRCSRPTTPGRRRKFAASLAAIVEAIPDFVAFSDRTAALGRVHAAHRIGAAQYGVGRSGAARDAGGVRPAVGRADGGGVGHGVRPARRVDDARRPHPRVTPATCLSDRGSRG